MKRLKCFCDKRLQSAVCIFLDKHNSCQLHRSQKERCLRFIQEKVQSFTRFVAIRTQTELMIRRVQFIRRTKEAATQAARAGNTRGYHSEYGNS